MSQSNKDSMRFSSTAAGLSSETTKLDLTIDFIEEAEANDEDDENTELLKKEKYKEPLFDGKTPLEKIQCKTYIFFYWLTPLVNYINTHGQISVEKYGKLRKKDMVENYIIQLR